MSIEGRVPDTWTEGKKFDEGKAPVDLVCPDFVLELSRVLGYGATKYEPYNWAKGMAWSRALAAAFRHLYAWMRGEDVDPETGLSHLAHATANLMFLFHFQKFRKGTDDRGFRREE